jgi:O-antigen ligase
MSKTKSTIYEDFYKFVLIFLPLLFSTATNEGYEFPKTIFLYMMSFLILAVFITDAIWYEKKINFGSIWIYIYLLLFGVSTFFSIHKYTSIVGYYTRFNGGLISLIGFFSLYFVAINVFSRTELQRLLRFSIYSLIPISIYAISQYAGNIPFLWPSQGLTRVSSTIGQPNWLAQYYIFVLLLCLYFSFLENSIFLSALFLLGFLGFWLTFSLSGFLGFAIGLLCMLFVVYKKNLYSKTNKIRLIAFLVGMLIVIGTNLGFLEARLNDVIQDIKKIMGQTRVVVYAQDKSQQFASAQLLPRVSDPGLIRVGIWKGIFALAFSSPKNFLFGTGPETFPYAFQPYRPLELNYSSEWEFVFNKPHNFYLELLVEQGVFGLILWLVLFFLIFKNSPIYLKPGIIGFAVSSFFGWPVTSTEIFFWMILAFSGAKKENA